jgi:hypothetical protein
MRRESPGGRQGGDLEGKRKKKTKRRKSKRSDDDKKIYIFENAFVTFPVLSSRSFVVHFSKSQDCFFSFVCCFITREQKEDLRKQR